MPEISDLQYRGDALSIEEITIVVRVAVHRSALKDAAQEALATLDPISRLLWLHALRHLH